MIAFCLAARVDMNHFAQPAAGRAIGVTQVSNAGGGWVSR
jgi:hypothetical protein